MPFLARDSGTGAHVLEGAVPAIVIQQVGCARKLPGRAVGVEFPPAIFAALRVPVHVSRDKQIKIAVVVVIEKTSRNRPFATSNSSLGGDVTKGSIAIVVVEDVLAIAGHEKVRIAIVVVVAYSNTHAVVAVACRRQAGLLGPVSEAAIPILAIQPVPVAGIAAMKVFRHSHGVGDAAAVHQEDVQQSVVVVVEECNAA